MANSTNQMTILEAKGVHQLPRVENLILLVGSNPVPNAVAAKLLVKNGGTLTLLHSKETASIATRLEVWLQDEASCGDGQPSTRLKVRLREVDPASPSSMSRVLLEELEKVGSTSVGLNYTGGTKAMAVHAYRTLENWAKAKGIKPVFTYLDARRLRLMKDPSEWGTSERVDSWYVGQSVKLSYRELFRLHGWTLRRELSTPEPVLPLSAKALAKAYQVKGTGDKWKNWVAKEVQQKCRKDNSERWRSNTDLEKTSLTLPTDSELYDVKEKLTQELGNHGEELNVGWAAKQAGLSAGELCGWFDGKWLETLAFLALRDNEKNLSLHDVYLNVNPYAHDEKPVDAKKQPVDFEIDVVGMRGYQLFAISCSTDSSKRLLKHKLFEAFIRARQLGGDEARVALVCCSDDPERLEREMSRDVDVDLEQGTLRVFGRKHLADLPAHLAEWVKSQSGEED
ncbi:MAG: hypothetical protein M1553_01050 [Firmicutes bacterium]|nr:hypothetical protein [Bacillota bacterium]